MWLPIRSAPKDGVRIMAFWPDPGVILIVHWRSGGWRDDDQNDDVIYTRKPSHWMPLPEFPRPTEKEGK